MVSTSSEKTSKAKRLSGGSSPQDEVESEQEGKSESDLDKTFFMKARIMAGQADTSSAAEAEDFKWLAKDEIQKLFHPAYWSRVKNMLVEQ